MFKEVLDKSLFENEQVEVSYDGGFNSFITVYHNGKWIREISHGTGIHSIKLKSGIQKSLIIKFSRYNSILIEM